MSVHKQVWFEVQPAAVGPVKALIREYAGYVADFAAAHNDEWRWRTYQEAGRPTRFCAVMWHRDSAAEARAIEAEGTRRFAENLYRHVLDGQELRFELIADSHR